MAAIADKVPVHTEGIRRLDLMAVRALVLLRGLKVTERFAADHAPGTVVSHAKPPVVKREGPFKEKLY
jgi:hypothetical protein